MNNFIKTIYSNFFAHSSAIYIVLTPIFSIAFALIGVEIPAYLFASILVFIISLMIIMKCGAINFKQHSSSSAILVYVLFVAITSILYLTSSNGLSGKIKFQNYFAIVFLSLALIYLSIFQTSKKWTISEVNKIYFYYFKYSTLFVVVVFVFFGFIDDNARYIIPGLSNPIWISRHVAAGLMVYIIYNFTEKNTMNIFSLLYLIVGFTVLIYTGSRAPVIALFICIFLYLNKIKRVSKVGIGTVIFVLSVLLYYSYNFSSSYLFEGNFYSLHHRLEAIKFTFEQPLKIFGNGISSFGYVFTGEDLDLYPHNIFAELYFEFGVIGIIYFVILTYAVFKSYKNSIPGLIALYYYINSMVSGDIPGNAPLLFSLLISWTVHKNISFDKEFKRSQLR
jgi:O-antigen ligase